MYKEKFANNLKALLIEHKIKSVKKIAKEIGVPHQSIYFYLNAQREVGLENLVKIANYFDENLDVLTGRKDY